MRRVSLLILSAFLLCFSVSAQFFEVPAAQPIKPLNDNKGICYHFDENNKTASVERCFDKISHSGSLVIPKEVWHEGDKYVVTKISSEAFKDCRDLTSVTIPDSVTELGLDIFSGCDALTAINVASGNPKYSSEDGVLFITFNTKQGKERVLKEFPKGEKGKYKIPDDANGMLNYAFEECKGLKKITIPHATEIPYGAFMNCTGLTEVQISNGLKGFREKAFQGCSSLKEITIPRTVTYIMSSAFSGCSALESITSHNAKPPHIMPSTFSSVNKTIPVYVPAESVEAYKTAEGWSEFSNIIGKSFKAPSVK